MICQYLSKLYSLRYTYYRFNLNHRPIYRSNRIGNCISRNLKNIKESDYTTKNDTPQARSTNINSLKNTNTSNLSINTNVLALNIQEMNICDKVTYMVNTAYKAGFILLIDGFIH